MAKYSSEQRKIARRIKQIGRKRGESAQEIKAGLATGLVESNLTNPQGGDSDSGGWRQERRRYYKDPTNLDASINRFYDETSKYDGKNVPSWEIAARVQRPAAQYRGRYRERSKEAQALLGGARAGQGTATSTREVTDTRKQPFNLAAALEGNYGRVNASHLAQSMLADAANPQTESRTRRVKTRVEREPGGTKGGGKRGEAFAKQYGLRKTSGWRSPEENRAAGGVPDSHHLEGTPENPGAEDFVGSAEAMKRGQRDAKRRGAKEAIIHNAGSGTHLHVAW